MSQHLAVEIEIIANATYWLPVTTWLDAVASIKGDNNINNNANINTESNVLDIGVARALETKRWNYIIYIYIFVYRYADIYEWKCKKLLRIQFCNRLVCMYVWICVFDTSTAKQVAETSLSYTYVFPATSSFIKAIKEKQKVEKREAKYKNSV